MRRKPAPRGRFRDRALLRARGEIAGRALVGPDRNLLPLAEIFMAHQLGSLRPFGAI